MLEAWGSTPSPTADVRKNGVEEARVREALFGLGAYVGEVLARRAGATWFDFDADQRSYLGEPTGVRRMRTAGCGTPWARSATVSRWEAPRNRSTRFF